MNIFNLLELCDLLHDLEQTEESFRWETHFFQSTDPVNSDQLAGAKGLVDRAYNLAYPLRFPTMFRKAENSSIWLDNDRGPNASALENELRNLKEAIHADLGEHSYLYVPRDRKNFIDNPKFLGEKVLSAFPSAKTDIEDAGNCLAADCNTAAVFHLMRVVEWGLRALCSDVGLLRLKQTSKSGKKKYVRVPYSDWEHILNQLHSAIDDRLSVVKRGAKKQRDQEFYYPILHDIKAIREAWRNHVMHTRAHYTHEEADAILDRVGRVMRTLATRVSEV